jgi:hypothetical protein
MEKDVLDFAAQRSRFTIFGPLTPDADTGIDHRAPKHDSTFRTPALFQMERRTS